MWLKIPAWKSHRKKADFLSCSLYCRCRRCNRPHCTHRQLRAGPIPCLCVCTWPARMKKRKLASENRLYDNILFLKNGVSQPEAVVSKSTNHSGWLPILARDKVNTTFIYTGQAMQMFGDVKSTLSDGLESMQQSVAKINTNIPSLSASLQSFAGPSSSKDLSNINSLTAFSSINSSRDINGDSGSSDSKSSLMSHFFSFNSSAAASSSSSSSSSSLPSLSSSTASASAVYIFFRIW